MTLQINRKHKIGSLKLMIKKLGKIPIFQQKLIFAGKELQDSRVVGDYKIEPLSVIHLVIKTGNGCFRENTKINLPGGEVKIIK